MKEWLKKGGKADAATCDAARDRTVGLIVFGTLDILFGIFCFAMAMVLLISVSAMGLGGMKPVHFHLALLFLFFMTGWFVVVGLGSIKARRWARALLLVGAWVAVFFGTLVLAVILFVLPEMYNLVADSDLFPPSGALDFLYALISVLVLLQVAFPVIGIAFYGAPSVQATCARLNPAPSWTDRCPLPLLAMSFISITGSFSILFAGTTNYTVFVFGHVLSGVPGLVVVAFISAVCGYVGWGAYTRKMHAWWGAYALIVLISASMMLTFSGMDMAAVYDLMGYTEEQSLHLQQFYPLSPSTLTFMSCAWGVMACIYLVWVRDLFRPERDVVEVKSYQQRRTEEAAAKPEDAPRIRMRLD